MVVGFILGVVSVIIAIVSAAIGLTVRALGGVFAVAALFLVGALLFYPIFMWVVIGVAAVVIVRGLRWWGGEFRTR